MRFTMTQLCVTMTHHAATLMHEQAPASFGLGVGDAYFKVAILPKDSGKTPAETDFSFAANPNRGPADIWDQVFIEEGGKWRCCGNRWGGVARFGELCGEVLASQKV